MARFISPELDALFTQIEIQANSGCLDKLLFTGMIQAMRDFCQGLEDTVEDLQDQITLCCGGTGGGNPNFSECANGGVPHDLTADNAVFLDSPVGISDAELAAAGFSDCGVIIRVTGNEACVFATVGGQNSGWQGTYTRTINVYCNGNSTPVGSDTQSVTFANNTSSGTFCQALPDFVFSDPMLNMQNGVGCNYTFTVTNSFVQTGDPDAGVFAGNADNSVEVCLSATCT